MGTWVAGQMPSTPQVPTVGTATYSGHVTATIRNGASQHLAAGNLASTINFGDPTASTAQVTNLDGFNYSGRMISSSTGLAGQLTTGTGPSAHSMTMSATSIAARCTKPSERWEATCSSTRNPPATIWEAASSRRG